MAAHLNVLFLSSEVEPFAKTGGLADVSSALPRAIAHLSHTPRIMMPLYASIDTGNHSISDAAGGHGIHLHLGGRRYDFGLHGSTLPPENAGITIQFLQNERLFGRTGLYTDTDTHSDYPDNDERFIAFSLGALEWTKHLGWRPDIVHCNDWQTGLVPAYLKSVYQHDPFFANTRTVFTIHNMAYQGTFPASSFLKTSLPHQLFAPDGVEAYGKLNMLKSGIVFADAVTTVSQRYSWEIQQSEEFGCGLEGVLRYRSRDLHGILNGIDYSTWDPATDKLIPQVYDGDRLDLKSANKKALLSRFNLPFHESTPLVGVVSRLAGQKGFDLVESAFDELMHMNLQFVLLGTGERKYHEMFMRAAQLYPEKVGVQFSFDNQLAHLIEAGSDMFLMPSRYEPCGLNQMYSLRYGTVPIVHATGGLDDTIQDVSTAAGGGTGFKFSRYDRGELLTAVRRALELYADKDRWRTIMLNGMARDFSWDASARRYVELYSSLAGS